MAALSQNKKLTVGRLIAGRVCIKRKPAPSGDVCLDVAPERKRTRPINLTKTISNRRADRQLAAASSSNGHEDDGSPAAKRPSPPSCVTSGPPLHRPGSSHQQQPPSPRPSPCKAESHGTQSLVPTPSIAKHRVDSDRCAESIARRDTSQCRKPTPCTTEYQRQRVHGGGRTSKKQRCEYQDTESAYMKWLADFDKRRAQGLGSKNVPASRPTIQVKGLQGCMKRKPAPSVDVCEDVCPERKRTCPINPHPTAVKGPRPGDKHSLTGKA